MKNRQLLILIALFAVTAGPNALGNLWESQGKIEERYGPPIRTRGYPGLRTYIYAFENFEVAILFSNGVSFEETYTSPTERSGFNDAEIERILKSNSGGGQWHREGESRWTIETANGRANAEQFPDETKPELRVFTQASFDQSPRDDRVNAHTHKEETLQVFLRSDKKTR